MARTYRAPKLLPIPLMADSGVIFTKETWDFDIPGYT